MKQCTGREGGDLGSPHSLSLKKIINLKKILSDRSYRGTSQDNSLLSAAYLVTELFSHGAPLVKDKQVGQDVNGSFQPSQTSRLLALISPPTCLKHPTDN